MSDRLSGHIPEAAPRKLGASAKVGFEAPRTRKTSSMPTRRRIADPYRPSQKARGPRSLAVRSAAVAIGAAYAALSGGRTEDIAWRSLSSVGL